MSDEQPQEPKATDVIKLQLSDLRDVQGQSAQTRFERFCDEVLERLTQTDEMGSNLFKKDKDKCSFKLEVDITRLSDDQMAFDVKHKITEKHPGVPGVSRSSSAVVGIGMAQRRKADTQMPMFDIKTMSLPSSDDVE